MGGEQCFSWRAVVEVVFGETGAELGVFWCNCHYGDFLKVTNTGKWGIEDPMGILERCMP